MRISSSLLTKLATVCLFFAGCAGPSYGPSSFGRGSPPVYMGQPPVYAPVTSPSIPSAPVNGSPTTPTQPTGPSAGQPSDLDLSLQPTRLQSMNFRGPGYGQMATLGQSIDGRSAPLGLARGGMPQKVLAHPDSVAGQITQTRAESAASGGSTAGNDDLSFRGGRIIKDLTYLNIFVGGPTKWNNIDRQWIDYALEAGMTDPQLNHVVMQYFNHQPVSADFRGSFWMSGYQPTTVSQGNLKQVIRLLYQQGSFNGLPLDSSVINFFLPPGTILQDPDVASGISSSLARMVPPEKEANSANGLGGYHGSVRIDTRTTVCFSVVVYSERKTNGTVNGIPVFPEPWKSITATAYHQLQEARTDPDVDDAIQSGNEKYLGWVSDRGQEIADGPVETAPSLSQVFTEVALADGSGTIPVQLLYSNAIHGPEGPLARPYAGSPLPPAQRKTPRPGSSMPSQPPSNSGPDPWLQYIDKEWSQLPDSVKAQVIKLIQQAANSGGGV